MIMEVENLEPGTIRIRLIENGKTKETHRCKGYLEESSSKTEEPGEEVVWLG
jgi:hypothetical protein